MYEFSRSPTGDAPLTVLADYCGYVRADPYPGYDPLFVTGKIIEGACNVRARRKLVEAADLLAKPGRPHEAQVFYRELDGRGPETPAERVSSQIGHPWRHGSLPSISSILAAMRSCGRKLTMDLHRAYTQTRDGP